MVNRIAPTAALQRLSPRQAEILQFIINFHADNNFMPSIREIAAAHGMKSPNGAVSILNPLHDKGYIDHGFVGKTRTVRGDNRAVARGLRVRHLPDGMPCGTAPKLERMHDLLSRCHSYLKMNSDDEIAAQLISAIEALGVTGD